MAIQKNKVDELKKKFLSDLDSWNKTLEDESSEWIKSIISFFEMDHSIVFGKDPGKAVNYLIQNKFFIDYNIKDRSIKVSKDDQMIGEWKNISIKTKIDEDGDPFAEISVDVWSVIDNHVQPDKKSKGKSK